MKELIDGINDATNADYHADRKYLSSSVLKTVLKSLEDYKVQYIDGIKKEFANRAALDEGSLAHAMILEPELVEQDFVFYPGFRKGSLEFEEFMASLPPERQKLPVISTPQLHRTKQLVEAYKASATATTIMANVQCEQTICGALHGVPIKVRFDAIDVENGRILDVKTTGYSGDVDAFKQTMKDLKYELSAALYCAMAEQYYNKPFDFYYIVLSKKDMTCNVYKTSDATMHHGHRMVFDACTKYLKAKATNVWTESATSAKIESAVEILEV
jgi:hypothetical protein